MTEVQEGTLQWEIAKIINKFPLDVKGQPGFIRPIKAWEMSGEIMKLLEEKGIDVVAH